MSAELHQQLIEISGLRVRPGEPMAAHVPLRVGGAAELWAVAEHADALRDCIRAARRNKVRWRLHWPLQDWVVRDGHLGGLTIRPGRGFEGIERLAPDRIRIGAATPWSAVAGLGEGWWAELVRWPGTPGGLFSDGEQDRIHGMCMGVRWLTGRGISEIEIEPGERPPPLPSTGILLSVDVAPGLLIFDGVDGPLPPRPGRLFADPEVAGRVRPAEPLLRDADVPGARLRAWRMTEHEPGTVVNLGGGTARDLHLFAQAVSTQVEKSRGIKLSIRIPVVGQDRLTPRRPLRGRR